MLEGPAKGLAIIDRLSEKNHLDEYHLLHAARADLQRRLGQFEEAAASYTSALTLVSNESERRYLSRRLQQVQSTKEPL
jgi:RNA polymerase sigma-70 factor (ECF subfamily)